MIYILTGIAKSGKTLLANEIKKRLKISVLSTDNIMLMLSRGNKDLNIDIYGSDSTVSNQLEPYIYALIKTMIENNETYLIEGVHFNTDFSKRLIDEFQHDIKIIYLGFKDISQNKKVEELLMHKDTLNNPWIFHHQNETLEEIVSYLIRESQRIFKECNEYGLRYIEISDIKKQTDKIISFLLEV